MGKLTKAQAKTHAQAVALLAQDRLSDDDKEFVFRNWNEGANHVNGEAGAFFTPFDMAFDMALDVYGGRIIDLCAGIGMLSYAAHTRGKFNGRAPEVVCVERNADYVVVGKKLLPEATWVHADVFDVLDMGLGRFDCAISNPPFGKVKRAPGKGAPRYTGAEFEFHVIDIAAHLAERGVFIVPQMSAGFSYSGRPCYERQTEGRAVKFQEDYGLHFDVGVGVDTAFYKDAWKGVSPICEIVCVDFTKVKQAANDNKPQADLFESHANAA